MREQLVLRGLYIVPRLSADSTVGLSLKAGQQETEWALVLGHPFAHPPCREVLSDFAAAGPW